MNTLFEKCTSIYVTYYSITFNERVYCEIRYYYALPAIVVRKRTSLNVIIKYTACVLYVNKEAIQHDLLMLLICN